MGSKKYLNKLCAYCAFSQSETGDHVVSRHFFPERYRSDLPIVPSCNKCNNIKSNLEHYLTTVLPFGSSHPTALSGQNIAVKKRLTKNKPLLEELRQGIQPVWIKEKSGLIVPSSQIPLDGKRLIEYFKLVVRGLVCYEWKCVVSSDYLVEVFTMPAETFGSFCATVLSIGQDRRRSRSFAAGGLKYTTTNSPDDPSFSLWSLQLYDQIGISACSNTGELLQLKITAITAPPSIREIIYKYLSKYV